MAHAVQKDNKDGRAGKRAKWKQEEMELDTSQICVLIRRECEVKDVAK